MAVPEINDLLIPLLETIKDKDEYKIKEVTDDVIDMIDISDEDKEIKLPNGETVIESRISTANTYLKKAELIESNRFLYYNITEEGLRVLEENPDGIDEEDLMQYPGFKELRSVFSQDDVPEEIPSPQDAFKDALAKQMEEVRKEINDDVMQENKVKYFVPKDQKESNEVYGIKSRRDHIKKEKEEKKKCHDKHKHHHGHHHKKKYIVYKEFSPADELLKYAELLERGYLTREEFDRKKEELLKL